MYKYESNVMYSVQCCLYKTPLASQGQKEKHREDSATDLHNTNMNPEGNKINTISRRQARIRIKHSSKKNEPESIDHHVMYMFEYLLKASNTVSQVQ